jgi:hypothetical protein
VKDRASLVGTEAQGRSERARRDARPQSFLERHPGAEIRRERKSRQHLRNTGPYSHAARHYIIRSARGGGSGTATVCQPRSRAVRTCQRSSHSTRTPASWAGGHRRCDDRGLGSWINPINQQVNRWRPDALALIGTRTTALIRLPLVSDPPRILDSPYARAESD